MALFFGGKHVLKDTTEGEWVGEVDITGGYKPALMGNAPGPHKVAVITSIWKSTYVHIGLPGSR